MTKLNRVKWNHRKYFLIVRQLKLWKDRSFVISGLPKGPDLLSFQSSLDKALDNAHPVWNPEIFSEWWTTAFSSPCIPIPVFSGSRTSLWQTKVNLSYSTGFTDQSHGPADWVSSFIREEWIAGAQQQSNYLHINGWLLHISSECITRGP